LISPQREPDGFGRRVIFKVSLNPRSPVAESQLEQIRLETLDRCGALRLLRNRCETLMPPMTAPDAARKDPLG
jgi:hypothetical protein